ncbi:transglutaminase-like putative cysteine protease [Sphingobium sp. B1D7B]|uniref:transglutaminase family protein n=1 Tax=unclassified Sphingobium TaxID=2611147 RepID=UPI0022259405|nr:MULTISPECIES: transglutaminase family protein [unclassified Sphingobium]MCW2392130.1 transglutaminase-like putative cysteine protease [Sphingobium sp. B11D3A]MCW2403836.1 transglutaminase-like putative cysteine protease [Sphingobium sp. B1D7B]
MRYRVSHIIRVDYDPPVRLAHFNLRLAPIAWPGQQVRDYRLIVDPVPDVRQERVGAYPFNLTRIEMLKPVASLEVRSTFIADVSEAELDLLGAQMSVTKVAQAALAVMDVGPMSPVTYIFPSRLLPLVPQIAAWARPHLAPDADCLSAALALARHIQASFHYDTKATEADTPVAEAFSIRRGVCQDFAHILIVALRAAGLPAGYVSGYLRTDPPPGQARLVGADAMHAWVALWCGPLRGWVGIDPTNGVLANGDHLVVGMGRDYSDISPIDGVFVGGHSQKTFNSVDVSPMDKRTTTA